MQDPLFFLPYDTWQDALVSSSQPAQALEDGRVVFLPQLAFPLAKKEARVLTPDILKKGAKNISYHYLTQQLGGIGADHPLNSTVAAMMNRFAHQVYELLRYLLPQYHSALEWGRTSYRPVGVEGRVSSVKKDDTRLHVDAFPSTPVQGKRILRVFSNINPSQQPRQWQVGEPFSEVAHRFYPRSPIYRPILAKWMQWLRITKQLRTAYDHYMLGIHDLMKQDEAYQATVTKTSVDFPALSTWIVFSDQVSHAALGGQYLLEQTFYLPVDALQDPKKSPLKILERLAGQSLVATTI